MTAEEFRAALERLDLTIVGAARFMKVGERTARRWAAGDQDIPYPVQLLLRVMVHCGVKPEMVDRM